MKTPVLVCFLSFCTLTVHTLAVQPAVAHTEAIILDNRALVNINSSFYFFGSITVSYNEALRSCGDLGMKLVSLQSEEKFKDIALYLDTNGYIDETFWTSGFRYYDDYVFIWSSTGERFVYTNWYKDQPNEPTGLSDVAVVMWNGLRQWYDVPMEYQNNVLCEEMNKFN